MPYVPKTWVDYAPDGPWLEAAELNRIEAGISAAARRDEAQSFSMLQTFTAGIDAATIKSGALTAGRLPIYSAAGLTDNGHLTFNSVGTHDLLLGTPDASGSAIDKRLVLTAPDGNNRTIVGRNGSGAGKGRLWQVRLGSSAGDYSLDAYDPATDALIDSPLSIGRAAGNAVVIARSLSAQRARIGNWAGGTTSVLYSRESFEGATGWAGLLLNAAGRAYIATAAGQALTLQQAGAPSDLATYQDSGILLNRATTITGPLKVDTIQGYTTSDEVAIGNTAAVLLLNASNGTSGARFRVGHAQTGSVLYRWQDSTGATQMTLSPSGVLTLAGGLTIGATPRITLDGAGSLTTLGLTGKASLAASATGAATLNIPAGTAPTSPVDGDVWQDGGDLVSRWGGVNGAHLREIYAATATGAHASTAERSVLSGNTARSASMSLSYPKASLVRGRRLSFEIYADLTCDGQGMQLKFKYGALDLISLPFGPGTINPWASASYKLRIRGSVTILSVSGNNYTYLAEVVVQGLGGGSTVWAEVMSSTTSAIAADASFDLTLQTPTRGTNTMFTPYVAILTES